MAATQGLASYGTYTSGVLGTAIASLIAAIPNPDAAHGSGAIAGGGFLDEMSPGAAAQLRVELAALAAAYPVASGQHTVTADEATANQADIVTGLADITLANCAVSVRRGGTLTGIPTITEPVAGTIRVADNSTTYDVTAGDVITWFAR